VLLRGFPMTARVKTEIVSTKIVTESEFDSVFVVVNDTLSQDYDVIVIGAGPAGLTAGIYCRRSGLKTLVIEKLAPGGQAACTDLIENYPGFLEISGGELSRLMEEHAKKFGTEILNDQVVQITDNGAKKTVKTTEGSYLATSVIVASGTQPKKLGVKGEDKLVGRGVSFCATCDGRFFQGKDVAVIGGGSAAVKEALYLAKMVRKAYVIHRRAKLRAEKIIQDKAISNAKIEFIWDSVLEEVVGGDKVEGVLVRNLKNDKIRRLDVSGVFLYVGSVPNTDFINVKKDENGFIETNEELATSMPGVFAAGDCRVKALRQVATAVGEGALAAFMAEKYIEESKEN
jgi:thioredoxin reductase (NADPH)